MTRDDARAFAAKWADAWNSLKVERVLAHFHDPHSRELAIVYTSETDGTPKRISENLTFNAAGQVVVAEVFHGMPLAAGRATIVEQGSTR